MKQRKKGVSRKTLFFSDSETYIELVFHGGIMHLTREELRFLKQFLDLLDTFPQEKK